MDRQDIIKWLSKYRGVGLRDEEVCQVLTSYCIERGKKKTDVLLKLMPYILISNRSLIGGCLDYAFDYWRKLHNIYIIEQSNPLIANRRNVVLIY